jgi:multiple sugar transport system permease protein
MSSRPIDMRIKKSLLFMSGSMILIVVLYPLAWLFINAIKTNAEAQKIPPYWIPNEITFDPLLNVVFDLGGYATHWGTYFINTIFITFTTTLIVVVLSMFVGYGLARFDIKGKAMVMGIFLIIQFLAGPAVMIPEFIFISWLGLYNTHTGLIITYVIFQVPFATWLFHSFFKAMPVELEEAAELDGCSIIGTFWRIVLPLMKTGIVTVAVMSFILTWSEYPFARILLDSDAKLTISIGLANYITAINIYWNQMAAASLICGLPLLIVLLFAQKYFIRGLTAGAIKG